MQAQLIPLNGGNPIPLRKDITLVGRKRGLCDVILDRSSVSKLQCLIVKTDGLLFIRDLGSTNGTKVNGQRVTRGALLPGDELAFASVKFRVHMGPGAPEADYDDNTEMMTSYADDEEDSPSDGNVEEQFPGPDEGPASDSDVRFLSDDSVV